MSPFLSADLLKEQYVVYGSFYNLNVSHEIILSCRNCLEIIDREGLDDIEFPEALFIMMNPGSSAPLDNKSYLSEYFIDDIQETGEVPLAWVLAKPDITQYQVMRVMNVKSWRYARVINLSDIREPQSRVFQANIAELKTVEPSGLHSIFAPGRAFELKKRFEINELAPIVLAWGTDTFLIDLAKVRFNACDISNAKGVPCDKSKYLFAHASPTLQKHKERWLEKILQVV